MASPMDANRSLPAHIEAQRVVEAMLREEEKFKQNKLLADRVLSHPPEERESYRTSSGGLLKPPETKPSSGPLAGLAPADFTGLLSPSAAGYGDTEALRRRVSSLEESNALLQHRVGQLESAVAVLARLVEHPLVQQVLDGGEDQSLGQVHARGAGNVHSGSARDTGDDEDHMAVEPEQDDDNKSMKRSRSGRQENSTSKKKWYELIALIKEMKPNNGYPIRCLIMSAIDSARSDPLYANSNIPERLERSLDNYCRKSAGPTKRAALQVLDSVWQFVQQQSHDD